jgi:hypothetical protein
MSVKILSIAVLSAVLSLGALTGCATNEVQPVVISTVPAQKTALALKDPDPIKTRKVHWFVITPENAESVFAELQKKKYSLVLFGLTDDGYENLSLNIAEIRAYMTEQKAIVKAYREYYEPNGNIEQKDMGAKDKVWKSN